MFVYQFAKAIEKYMKNHDKKKNRRDFSIEM